MKSLIPFKKKVSELATQVESMEIGNAKELSQAVTVLSSINKYADSVKEQKEKLTRPINESLKNIRLMFKPLEESYEGAIKMLREKMSKYQTAEVARAKEEQAKIALTEGIDTAIAKMNEIAVPDKSIETKAGTVQFREVKKFKVMDMTLLPIEYHLPDERSIQAKMKEGKELPGVKYYTEQMPVNYR
jgi:hypothetical protein